MIMFSIFSLMELIIFTVFLFLVFFGVMKLLKKKVTYKGLVIFTIFIIMYLYSGDKLKKQKFKKDYNTTYTSVIVDDNNIITTKNQGGN